mmetsp:Transcript_13000/g.24800  ORF Transcript_13000/g.24800 Transcript_13000/m.24800 type:complete len:683 (-) Transcript_13000:83-2131(-)
MHPEVKVFIASVVLILLGSLFTTQHFAAPETRWHVRLDVMLSLATSALIIALVPFDVYTTLQSVATPLVPVFWSIAYWTTQALTWLLLPIHQIYADAGDFTVASRLHTAVRENLQFYAVVAAMSVVGVVLLMVFETVTLTTMAHTAIAFSNTFGIATGMFLMGYGLVDVPRMLWNNGDCSLMLERCEQNVAELADALQQAHSELAHAVLVVQTTAHTMPRRHPLRWAMDIIDKESTELVPMRLAGDLRFEEMGDDFDYDFDDVSGLASLRRRLKRATTVYLRTKYQYVLAVQLAFKYEDIVENKKRAANATDRRWRYRSVGQPPGGRWWSGLVEGATYLWKCVLRTPLLRAMSVVMAVASVSVVLAESTIWISNADLSLFSHIIDAIQESNTTGVQVVVMLPLLYMCFCTYYSLFKLGKFRVYSLTPHSSDAFSLLLCAALVCRYSAPMCYNFLTLVPVVHEGGRKTVFDQMMGNSGTSGAFDLFNRWFPLVLPVYCLLIIFNAFHRLAGACCGCCSTYNFDERVTSLELCDKGADILRQERANRVAGLGIGEGTVPTSSSSADLLPLDPREPRPFANDRHRSRGMQNTSLGRSLNRPGPNEFELDMEHKPSLGNIGASDESSARWDSARNRLSQALETGNRSGTGARTAASSSLQPPPPQSRRLLDSVFAGISSANSGGEV